MRRLPLAALMTAATLPLAACGGDEATGAGGEETATTSAAKVKTIASGLDVPWGVAFLPSGDALVAERTTGDIVQVPKNGGKAKTVMTVPGVLGPDDAGEGGLLGLALSPTYKRDKLVYAYYTTSSDNRIARFKLGGKPQPILTGLDSAGIHNGGRIAFGPDRKLYAGVGDAGETSNAQDPESQNGKILRMNPDGSVPSDNPTAGSRVYTSGHRNVQGLAWDGKGRMYAAEFGQNTFDEVNRIQAGKNYGWPNVEGKGGTDGGKYTNPLVTWDTSDASPSGIAISGGRLYMAALGGESVYRMTIRANGSLGTPKRLYEGRWGRLRTVVNAPGRGLWLTTSNEDGRGTPKSGDDHIYRIPG